MSLWYDDVLAALKVPSHRRCAVKWMVNCPSHKDLTPSLSVGVNRAGDRVLLKCFAGCPAEMIVATAGLKMTQLFKPRQNDVPLRARVIDFVEGFLDESGELLYEEVRYRPKDFRQRRPCPQSGEWLWNLMGVRMVLLRTPEIIRKPTATVFVVEGCKAVRLLESAGLLATTGAGGCGMGWQDGYAAQLAGRRVTLLPDNDVPGRKLMQAAAGSLIAHGVGSLRWVDLPGRAEREGADDYMAANGKDAMLACVRAAKEWRAQ